MVDKLEACPFCGGEASLTIPSEHVQADCADIYVSCDECEAEGQHFVVEMQDRTPDLWPYEQRDAIAAWNRRAPANGEQVERVTKAISDALADDERACWEKIMPTAARAAMNPTPTEDARSRVKVLEEALEWYAREFSWRSSTVYMCGHSGPSSAELDRGQRARTALGNKETDRHG